MSGQGLSSAERAGSLLRSLDSNCKKLQFELLYKYPPGHRQIMSKFTPILISLLLFSTASNANVTVTYRSQDQSYFNIEIPDSWQVNVGSDTNTAELTDEELAPPRVITVMPDDGSILWFGAWVPVYLHSLDAAQEYLSSLDGYLVDDPVLRKTDNVNLNEMAARYFTGKGEKEGAPVDFFVMLFEISEDTIGIAIYIGPPDTTNAHRDVLRGMMKSITPIGE